MVVVSHLFFFFQINFREGMTQRKSYPPCFGTIYFHGHDEIQDIDWNEELNRITFMDEDREPPIKVFH